MPVKLMKSITAPLGRETQGNEQCQRWEWTQKPGLSVQTAGWNPLSPSPLFTFLAWKIFHSTDFTTEGSTAVKTTVRSSVCGTKCCLFLIFPPEYPCQDNTPCSLVALCLLHCLSLQHSFLGFDAALNLCRFDLFCLKLGSAGPHLEFVSVRELWDAGSIQGSNGAWQLIGNPLVSGRKAAVPSPSAERQGLHCHIQEQLPWHQRMKRWKQGGWKLISFAPLFDASISSSSGRHGANLKV